MSKDNFAIKDEVELDLYLQMIVTILFGSSSLFREKIRNKHLMTSFYYNWETIKDYKTLLIFAETENPDLLINEVDQELKNIDIAYEDFERMKKVWIANEVKMIDFVDNTVNNIYDDMIRYHKLVDNRVELIRQMNKKTLDNLISDLKFNNFSKIILLPKKIIAK